jgi:hypothetical protein
MVTNARVWRRVPTLPPHSIERISFYGCRTLRFLKGPGLDAASLLNLCGNRRLRLGHGYRERSALCPESLPAAGSKGPFAVPFPRVFELLTPNLARSGAARPHPTVCA